MGKSRLDSKHGFLAEKENVSSNGVLRRRSSRFQSRRMGTPMRPFGKDTSQAGHRHYGSATLPSLAQNQGTTQESDALGTDTLPTDASTRPVETLQLLYTRLSRVISQQWNAFFYSPCQYGKELGGIFRIAFACIMLSNYVMLGLDYEFFFLPSQGLLPLEFGRQTVDYESTWTLFSFIPQTDTWYWAVYCGLLLHIVLLGLGVAPRLNAVGVFLWHSSFVTHSNLLWNGEDCAMRLYAFMLIFVPLDHLSIWKLPDWYKNKASNGGVVDMRASNRRRRHQRQDYNQATSSLPPMWPFRLIQLQFCFIYFSTVTLKWTSKDWRSGSALYHVVQLDDLYGGLFNPHFFFGYLGSLKLLSYGSLLLETVAPALLWVETCRIPVLLSVIGFHLSIDASMNLNCFHSIMVLGWLSFLAQPNRTGKEKHECGYCLSH